MTLQGMVHPILLYSLCARFLEPEEMDNTCGKMMHTEMMDRGFNVLVMLHSWKEFVK
jgi:hypothetical protein